MVDGGTFHRFCRHDDFRIGNFVFTFALSEDQSGFAREPWRDFGPGNRRRLGAFVRQLRLYLVIAGHFYDRSDFVYRFVLADDDGLYRQMRDDGLFGGGPAGG